MVRNFQLQFPKDVAGMVLVDGTSDDTRLIHFGKLVRMRDLSSGKPIPPVRTTILPEEKMRSARPAVPVARIPPPSTAAAAVAAPSSSSPPSVGPALPPDIHSLRAWAAGQIERGTVDSDGQFTGQEFAELYQARQAHAHVLGDMPLIVLIARKRQIPEGLPPEWPVTNEEINQQEEQLAAMSTRGKFVYAQNSTHMIPYDEPQVVINAIQEVVEAASKNGLASPGKRRMR